MRNWIVYKHTSPSGKVYIGITNQPANKRWKNGMGYISSPYFFGAIVKYGWINIQHEILFSDLEEEEAKETEKRLIRVYKEQNVSYNITDGGEGHLGCSWTPTVYTRTIWSTQRKDRKLSEEHKKKISDTMKGRPMSKDVYIKGVTIVKTLLAKPVIQLSLSGEFIREFPSIKEAARSLNIKSDRDIIRCCKGERKSRAGYKWKYKNE